MSFEGRYQVICGNGHLYDEPYNYADYRRELCDCGAPAVWSNLVDDTNCDAYGIIPDAYLEKFIIDQEDEEFGPIHSIPSDSETTAMRDCSSCALRSHRSRRRRYRLRVSIRNRNSFVVSLIDESDVHALTIE